MYLSYALDVIMQKNRNINVIRCLISYVEYQSISINGVKFANSDSTGLCLEIIDFATLSKLSKYGIDQVFELFLV